MDFITIGKEILKKYGISAIISLVIGIGVVTYYQEWIREEMPFGKHNIYWALVFCSAGIIILIRALQVLFQKIKNINYKIQTKKKYNEHMLEEERENLSELWKQVDLLSESDRKDIIGFIESNNTPIERKYILSNDFYDLYNSRWVVKTTRNYKDIYKLDDEIFKILKLSYEKYGKISNFD